MQKEKIEHNIKRTKHFFKWLAFSVIIAVVVGFIGIAFDLSLEWANNFRTANEWLIYLLPIGGLLIVGSYDLCKMLDDKGTNFVLVSVRSSEKITFKTAPLIFISTVITHLLGGSSGREGAALQLGGSIADKLARILKLDEKDKRIFTMCGMAAAFSAVFGTPVAAAVFSMEVISVGVMYYAAIVPCIVSAALSSLLVSYFNVHTLACELTGIPKLNFTNIIRVICLGILIAGLSWIFCFVLRNVAKLFKQYIKNPYLRVLIGGILIILLTKIIGTYDYNGVGSNVLTKALSGGEIKPEAFLLKMIFTAITIGSGFKGGEIVPTFFTGATFGGTVGKLLGLNSSFAAGLGMIGLFCGVTNCPMTSLIISIELFGSKGIIYFALISAFGYMLSGYTGLYSEQKILYSKFRPVFIDKKVNEKT